MSLSSCHEQSKEYYLLSDMDWYDAITTCSALAGLQDEEVYVYKYYESNELSNEIRDLYLYGSKIFNYQINDSINEYILTRENRLISNHIDTLQHFEYITDITSRRSGYMLLSEPFFIDDELVCFSISLKNSDDKNGHWIYFYKKNPEVFQIMGYYDVKQKQYYTATPL